jgi:hypothetical protein
MSVSLPPFFLLHFFDPNNTGVPLSGGKLFTYIAGTSTKQPTYTDSTQTVQNSNPIILNSRGECSMWLDQTLVYKLVLAPANDTDPPTSPLNTVDNVITPVPFTLSQLTQQVLGTILYPQTPAEIFANVTPVLYYYPPGNALRYGVDPTGTVDSTALIQNWIDATWAMWNWQDGQGLWNGGGGAAPIMTLPPGKYMVSNTMYLPTSCTLKGAGHPANTVSHTRIIMNSTGVTPVRTWTASTAFTLFQNVNPGTGLGTYYFSVSTAGTSGSSAPNWMSAQSAGAFLSDGTMVWQAQLPMTAGDNRNNPMFKFRRGTLPPSLGNGTLQNSACTTTIQELEFWFVTLQSTFSNPLSGRGIGLGDYPAGGTFSFDVDADDFRFKDCVFQHTPAAIRSVGINTTPATRGDGFSGNRGLGIFFENCEFDAAAAHFYLQTCYLDFYIESCEFFGAIHRFEGCTGQVRYQSGDMSGNAYIDAITVPNSFTLFAVQAVDIFPISNVPQIGIDFTGLTTGPRMVDVSENTITIAAVNGGINVLGANTGRVSDNSLNDLGFNAPPGTGPADFIAAIKCLGCQNLLISGNNITSTDTATYNGFGILTAANGATASTGNFVNNNAVTAPYNAANFNGQDRYINLAAGDIYGTNFNIHSVTNAPSQALINVQGQASTGSQTATFTATNKPGTGTTAPDLWVSELIDGVLHYSPRWK